MKKKNRESVKIVASERSAGFLLFSRSPFFIFCAFLHCGAWSQAKICEIMGLVGMFRKTKIKMFIAKNQPLGANW